ncbi:MAG: RnfABCDGE type electron transport complex subunit G [Deltaproteobacteria bacterium]|nr:RnfABCDGE type electron transport complex subunit G [Deltaproteobacteria bacterium]
MFLNLTVVGAVSGVILAGVFHVADPLIQANKEKELKEAIFVVLPEAKDYKIIEKTIGQETFKVYEGLDANGTPVGLAFKADGGGFQGNVGVMVGLNLDYLKLKGIKILDQVETPGLGNRISEPAFEEQFKGIEITPKVEYIKNRKPEKPNQIQAITGATISSSAVVSNINRAVEKVLKEFPKDEVGRLEKEIRPASATAREKGAEHGGK